MTNEIAAIILAAGKGKRMKSDMPKVLHLINGVPIIRQLLASLKKAGFSKIVVVIGYKGEQVIDELQDMEVDFVWQKEQLGTGHAVMMTEKLFAGYEGTILVAVGDVPFLSPDSVRELRAVHNCNNASATCLSAVFSDPTGYGRIVRKKGTDILLDIVEHKDADPDTQRIAEINSGIFCFAARDLFQALRHVNNKNVQQEYYLTDTVRILRSWGKTCAVWKTPNPLEVMGVNSLDQLISLEKASPSKKSQE
ncbi:MAG: NTP transferase domain-containing protein [Candidatus Zixiibacteriota bacterium]|nr:MAG: NTP transferase domain-containing protein [candidate division Zixibacteria bacterium]